MTDLDDLFDTVHAQAEMITELEKKLSNIEKYNVNGHSNYNERIEKLEHNQEQIMNIQRGNVDVVHGFKKELSELKNAQDNLWKVKENQIQELRDKLCGDMIKK